MINNTYFVAMQNIYHFPIKKITLIAAIIVFTVQFGKAQSVYLPYSYQLDQKFNSSIYSINSSFHTSLKPFLIDSLIAPRYNQLMNVGVDSTRKGWIVRKLLNEHLFDVKTKEYTFYGDYLPDLQLGRDFSDHITTDLNTRGYQFGGTVGDKFFFYTSGYENQGKFPTYYSNVVKSVNIIPGQAYNRDFGQAATTADWSYVTAIMSYTPIKQLNITLGEDKTFIGDGYRSLLLSDFSPNYPLLRLTANLGKVQYMIQWAYMEDQKAPQFDSFGNNRRKWGAFHYLDWNITNRLSLGYFDAIIVSEADDQGHLHGFDPNFIDPIVYTNSINSMPSQPDNALMGFTAKYKILDKSAIYGQLLLDRVSGSGNGSTNGFQLGIRGADLFKVTNFNYLFEFNTVKPYTYASAQPITSYTNFEEPLGDPLGANFREFIGILNYSIGRFDFMGQVNYAKYGLDPKNADFGKNIMAPYVPSSASTTVGQGITTSLYYGEGTISYLINPKYNLRLEGGALLRAEKNALGDNKTVLFTFGLRSTFRNLYHDF
jgi:hypothetical protein